YWKYIDETYQYADSLVAYALSFNPNIQIYLYEDWHCIKSGTPTGCDYDIDANPWRQRLDDDLAMWESVVDTLNNRFNPTNPVCIIPAGQGLARLYDAIERAEVPDINSIDDIFSDDIHLTDVGKYFVACVHFAMIHNTSPVGLTNQTQVWWGGDFDPPTKEQAKVFQEIARETVNSYERSCLLKSTASVEEIVNKNPIVYDSFTDILTVQIENNTEYTIYNLFGQAVLISSQSTINLSSLPNGVFFVRFGEVTKMIIK
ncbi:MAG: T9SS type A sorting domain-containing protein, partial [Candidatus Kapaibacterium sp.]